MASEGHTEKSTRHGPWMALVVVGLGYFINVLDSTAVNIAVPTIVSDLNASTEQILWVLNGYLFPFAMLLLLGGRLGDIVGHRNVFFGGLLLFTIASLVCALARVPEELIAGRVLQGIGAAAAAPQALAITAAVFPPERRAMAYGVLASVIGSAAAAAPALGGVLTDVWGWRSIFYLNIPVGLFGLAAAFIVLPATRDSRRQRLPIVTSLVACVGLFPVLYALIEGARFDWGQVWGPVRIWHLLLAGVLVLTVFMFWERAGHGGLLPRAIFTSRNYALMVVASMATYAGIFGSQIVMTIYLQSGLGVGALTAGLALSPMWLASCLAAPAAGRLSARFSAKSLLITGFVVFSIGIAWTALLVYGGSSWAAFVVPLVVAGTGAGLTFSLLPTVAMQEVAQDSVGGASGLIEVVRQVGAAVSIAMAGAILQAMWMSSMGQRATSEAKDLPLSEQEEVAAGVDQLADRGLNAGSGQPAVDLPDGVVGRILEDASSHGFVVAATLALLVTAAVIVTAAVASGCVSAGAGESQSAQESVPAGTAD